MDPNSYHPPGWEDDERMSYLFSAFRDSRDVNPHDWDNKLSFWTQAIGERCRREGNGVIECDSILDHFKRKGRIPVVVNRVLIEMARSGKIVRQYDFEANMTAGWIAWGINQVVYRPLGWAYSAIFKRNQQALEGSFILMEVVKEIAESIVETHHQCVDTEVVHNLVDYATLRNRCRSVCKDDNTFRLALLHLRKNRKITMTDAPLEQQVIKFLRKNQTRVSSITETEIGVLRLKKTIALVEQQIELLTEETKRLQEETRQRLRKGFKSSAKSALRKKKLAEKSIERKEATLDTLHQMIDRIENAESTQMTIDAYKSGASALKKVLASHNLTPESVDESMSEVQEVMEMCSEIDDTISRGNRDIDETLSLDSGIDTDALEAELADLLTTDEPGDQSVIIGGSDVIANSSMLADLPTVPQAVPSGTQEERVSMATAPMPLTS